MVTEKIILCDECEGTGMITQYVRWSLHDSERMMFSCKACNGTGRLIETTTVTIEPARELSAFINHRELI